MIKVEAIEDFTLKEFKKLNNIKRKLSNVDGMIFKGDTFECSKEMVKYLMGGNKQGKIVVKVIEFEPKKDSANTNGKLDYEYITPLGSEEELEKLSEQIMKCLKPKKVDKKKK